MFMVQLSVEGGHFTSAEKVGDDTHWVKYLSHGSRASGNVSQRTSPTKLFTKLVIAPETVYTLYFLFKEQIHPSYQIYETN